MIGRARQVASDDVTTSASGINNDRELDEQCKYDNFVSPFRVHLRRMSSLLANRCAYSYSSALSENWCDWSTDRAKRKTFPFLWPFCFQPRRGFSARRAGQDPHEWGYWTMGDLSRYRKRQAVEK